MSFTFETFHVLKSPLKALAPKNMPLGGKEEGGALRATVRSRHRQMTQETHPDVAHRHVDVRVSSKTTTHMLLGLLLGRRECHVGKERSGAVFKAYRMSSTFETSHVLKSPLKKLA